MRSADRKRLTGLLLGALAALLFTITLISHWR